MVLNKDDVNVVIGELFYDDQGCVKVMVVNVGLVCFYVDCMDGWFIGVMMVGFGVEYIVYLIVWVIQSG